ncbi:type VII secretion target [Plantactinospora sp. WMMC1484]|uniref:type VII secretion target n=1 Tax=Plantactinospora sp. WMMC1484 TaxID=3404122 RepID=UPI003BF56A81
MPYFKAEPAIIREFGAEIAGLVDDAEAAQRYTERWLEISGDRGPLYQTAFDAVARIRGTLTLSYAQLANVLTLSAQEVDRAADYYQSTDARSAETFDRTY